MNKENFLSTETDLCVLFKRIKAEVGFELTGLSRIKTDDGIKIAVRLKTKKARSKKLKEVLSTCGVNKTNLLFRDAGDFKLFMKPVQTFNNGPGSGGFFVFKGSKKYLVSAAHTLGDKGDTVWIAEENKKGAEAKVVKIDVKRDIGIAEIIDQWPQYLHTEKATIENSYLEQYQNADVYHVGSTSGEKDGQLLGVMDALDSIRVLGNSEYRDLLELKIKSTVGDSGAPVLIDDGTGTKKLIGLIVGGDTQDNLACCSNLYKALLAHPEWFDGEIRVNVYKFRVDKRQKIKTNGKTFS